MTICFARNVADASSRNPSPLEFESAGNDRSSAVSIARTWFPANQAWLSTIDGHSSECATTRKPRPEHLNKACICLKTKEVRPDRPITGDVGAEEGSGRPS